MDVEIEISERERVLARVAEETDTNNHRVRREQRHQKETKEEMRAVKKQIQDMELEIDQIRRENGKRREGITKKEIAIMEKAKKN